MGLTVVRAIVGRDHRTERNGTPAASPQINGQVASEAEERGGKRHAAVFTIGGAFAEADEDTVPSIASKVGVAEALQQIVGEARAIGFVAPAQHVRVAADTGNQVRGIGEVTS